MGELLDWIRLYGFPAAITVYVLVVLRATLKELEESISELRLAVTRLLDEIQRRERDGG